MGAVETGRVSRDEIMLGFACAEGVNELAFDAGDVGVEDLLGF